MLSFDLHVHTGYSMDSATNPRSVARIAKRRGLNGVAVTDHNTIRGGLEVAKCAEPGFHVIVGSEIRTEMGDIMGLFLNEEIKSTDPFEVIDEIKCQGGVTVLPHPFRSSLVFRKPSPATPLEIAEKVDAIEVFNARTLAASNEKALILARKLNKPMVAGSDAHFYPEMGNGKTLFPAPNGEEELKQAILTGKTAVERVSHAFIRAVPFYFIGFLYARTRNVA